METYKRTAGTKVRTIYGELAELVLDWFDWDCTVTVRTLSGHTERYHPTKVYTLDGQPLPYRP
jgi:hypothetical protein